MFLVLSLASLAHATASVVKTTQRPAAESTLLVIVECTAIAAHSTLGYAGLQDLEIQAARLNGLSRNNTAFDTVVHIKNPSRIEYIEALSTIKPAEGQYRLGVLALAAPGFGRDHGVNGLMCSDFDAKDTSTPDGEFPFEGTLLSFDALRQAMFDASQATFAILDDSPDYARLIDLPPGIATVGMSADDWGDVDGYAVSAAGPGKNAKFGLLKALNDVLETSRGPLSVKDLRQKVRFAAISIDSSIVAYDAATGRFKSDENTVLFTSASAVVAQTKPPTKSKVVPIASFAAAGACAIGGGILALEANGMYETAIDDPAQYEGRNYDDLVAQFNGYKYGAMALGSCTAVGAGLGVTVLLTNGSFTFTGSPTNLNFTGSF
ncbi:MAG: hypothetical protein NUV56_00320 [Candidatus Uhrbacteria bacterium]|nr:hypothetical protein [Candidatus Uhrbacteria bacterium]